LLNWVVKKVGPRHYFLMKNNDIDPYLAESAFKDRTIVLGSEGYKKWFTSRKMYFYTDFLKDMESIIEVSPTNSMPFSVKTRHEE